MTRALLLSAAPFCLSNATMTIRVPYTARLSLWSIPGSVCAAETASRVSGFRVVPAGSGRSTCGTGTGGRHASLSAIMSRHGCVAPLRFHFFFFFLAHCATTHNGKSVETATKHSFKTTIIVNFALMPRQLEERIEVREFRFSNLAPKAQRWCPPL